MTVHHDAEETDEHYAKDNNHADGNRDLQLSEISR